MKFGPVPVGEAQGAILAHSLDLGGQRLRKGRTLSAEDINALQMAGHADVIVARLAAQDLGEDEAATEIASALVSDPAAAGLRLTRASTGRVNIYATGLGLLVLDAAALEAANLLDPMITVATLPNHARTRENGMVATVKIISYGVAKAVVDDAARLLRGAMWRHPVTLRTATLVQTDIGSGPGKGQDAIRGRLDALGITLSAVQTVPHRVDPIAEKVRASSDDLVLILTASATSDPFDVAPEAVRLAGGEVHRFGMPVDPGNLLFLGAQAGRPVIGLPGCARSPALNGADWVLERVACGIPVSDNDIAAMGVGGLLKESPARPFPRERRKNESSS